ncbi:YjjG family noncanonical pyrimidine nucleotidase [Carboxylicivirga linearis]|uniref:YjjG family noncanonical pyrimidine nucleotidase n=1 Tax=Carboxylicivirga linearis TaxID=1628157 RepID=A0ABS5JSZ9_9BACT|nr:YjjG family noncanonical pyrimidine nucleotidase [Carboxylicivirga linearis]MBS2097987.1 YjjG family noncanonical pyrimidine nucleotidase [Carboxylicivirga linearis]
MERKYKHLFFDLDHTLWDFEANSEETLIELFDSFHLNKYFDDFNDFHARYETHNLYLWSQYRKGNVDKKTLNTQRFYLPFSEVGFDDIAIAQEFAKQYLAVSPTKTRLFPNTIEVLKKLQPHYQMHIITNGFREVQSKKLKNSGLAPFFKNIYISELIGVQKPHPYFFDYFIRSCNTSKKEALVIGDSLEADIEGAIKAGIDQVFFNSKQLQHEKNITHEISALDQLLPLLL